jgi:hypothetical protein
MSEVPRADDIEKVYQLLLAANQEPHNMLNSDYPLEFQPLAHQESGMVTLAPELRLKGIPVAASEVRPDRVPYTDAWNVGKLVWVSSQEDLDYNISLGVIRSNSIIASDQPLRDFPPVAGVISGIPLTSASHAVLLAQMYSAPVVYIKDASRLFQSRSGEKLYLNAVSPPGSVARERKVDFIINISDTEAARLLEFKSKPKLTVSLDLSETVIRSVRELDRSRIGAYGGKASQMGIIMNTIPDLAVNEAVGIPIYYFKSFMSQAKVSSGETLEKYVARRLSEIPIGEEFLPQGALVLADIRVQIEQAQIPADLLKSIRDSIEKFFPDPNLRLKLRSSSNVEDGAEFNGAGLYDSKGAWFKIGGLPAVDFESNLKIVWASLYTQRGVAARGRFSADESRVGMGVLVHPTFKGEINNGVASIYVPASGEAHFECITQVGEELVTHANGEVQAEQISIDYDQLKVDQPYEGFSKTRTLMKSEDYWSLRKAMIDLAKVYAVAGTDVHIESEWKQMPGNNGPKLVIKQVRPVPKTSSATGIDGSKYFVLIPQDSILPEIDQPNYAFEALFSPRNVRLDMPSFSEKEMHSGKVKVNSISYDIGELHFSISYPKIHLSKNTNSGNDTIEIMIQHPYLKTMRLVMDLSSETSAHGVASPLGQTGYLEYKADASDFTWLKKVFGEFNLNSYSLISHYDPNSDWNNPLVIGTAHHTISVAGKTPMNVELLDVKERGEGDGRETKIGRAVITGLLKHSIEISHYNLAYGANHHSDLENFVFDIQNADNLTKDEKKWLSDHIGDYLVLNADGSGEAFAYGLSRAGKTRELGTWSKEATP